MNFATYVGHSNLRRWVMGPDATEREATPAEVAEMRRLVAEADILVENYRPGVMRRLGFGWEACRDINPKP